jgi:hypothetical protein
MKKTNTAPSKTHKVSTDEYIPTPPAKKRVHDGLNHRTPLYEEPNGPHTGKRRCRLLRIAFDYAMLYRRLASWSSLLERKIETSEFRVDEQAVLSYQFPVKKQLSPTILGSLDLYEIPENC